MKTCKLLEWTIIPLVLVALGIALWWGLGRSNRAQAQDGPAIRPVAQALSSNQARVAVNGSNLVNLGGFEFDLTVDPTVARIDAAQVSTFLGSSGRMVETLGPILGSQGESLALGAYSYDPSGQNAPGPSGDGTLVVITLTVAGDGISPLSLANPLFVDVEANTQGVSTFDAALQAKTLHSGWNLLAPCVDTAGMEVPQVLESLSGRFDMAFGERGTYVAGLPPEFQSLREIVPPWGYYVRVQGSTAVTLTQVAPPFDPSTPIPLMRGWRWVGYCMGAAQPITVALQSIEGAYDMVLGETGTYVAGLPPEFQSLRELRWGTGYLIRMTQDANLIFPSEELNVRTSEDGNRGIPAPQQYCTSVPISPYLMQAYGEVYVNGKPAPARTVVEAVTPRGETAGCFVVQEAGRFGVMHLFGRDDDGYTPGFLPGEPVAWRVDGQAAMATSELSWNGDRELYHIALTAVAGGPMHLFLPMIMK